MTADSRRPQPTSKKGVPTDFPGDDPETVRWFDNDNRFNAPLEAGQTIDGSDPSPNPFSGSMAGSDAPTQPTGLERDIILLVSQAISGSAPGQPAFSSENRGAGTDSTWDTDYSLENNETARWETDFIPHSADASP